MHCRHYFFFIHRIYHHTTISRHTQTQTYAHNAQRQKITASKSKMKNKVMQVLRSEIIQQAHRLIVLQTIEEN
jgi:hypothetical protein